MRIAILSDIHDQVWHVEKALAEMKDADMLLGCGDYCSPFVVAQLAAAFSGPIHLVEGNNDGDLYRITQVAGRYDHLTFQGEFYEGEEDGCQLALTHYPALARPLARSGKYDLVCYGHDHTYHTEKLGETQLINPGPLMGYDPLNQADVPASWVMYDTDSGEIMKKVV